VSDPVWLAWVIVSIGCTAVFLIQIVLGLRAERKVTMIDLNARCDQLLSSSDRPNRGKKWRCTLPPGHEGPHSKRPCYFCQGPIEDERPNCYACRSCDT
jgi:hypothetical protein